jgi:hypothetical protein
VSLSRQAPDTPASAPRLRISIKDAIAILILLGWTAAGVMAMAHDVSVYRAQQAAAADFATRHQTDADQAPYRPEFPVKLVGEVTIGVIGFALLASGLRFWRRNSVRVSIKFVSAPRQRTAPAETKIVRSETFHSAKSGAIAAERLSVVVWTDHLARLEKKRA